MAIYTWEFNSKDGRVQASLWYDTVAKKFTVASVKGSFDLNALWVSDGDKIPGEGGILLRLGEAGLAMIGTKITWDDVGILSLPSMVPDIQRKDSYIAEGDTKTFDLARFRGLDSWFKTITDFSGITLGISATRVNGFGSEKLVATNAAYVLTTADADHVLYNTADYFALQGDNATESGATQTLTVLAGAVTLEDQSLQLPEGYVYTQGIGDVFYVGAKNGATVNFGNDQILGSTSGDYIFGDLDADYSSSAYPGGGTYNFGNDELYGADGNDIIYGDARQLGNFPSLPDTGAEYQGTYRTGSDTISGGIGDDYLIGDIDQGNSGVFLFEKDLIIAGTGNNTLVGDVTYLLAFSDPITAACGDDNLIGGSQNDELYGDAAYVISYSGVVSIAFGDDELLGAEGDDILCGDAFEIGGSTNVARYGNDKLIGGKGNDRLFGGQGADQFVFNTRPSSISNVDIIEDFNCNDGDKLVLSKSVFTQLSGNFSVDLGARLIYDSETGALSYKPYAFGPGAGETLCILANKPDALTADCFLLIG